MKFSRHFLIPLLSVSVAGGAVVVIIDQSSSQATAALPGSRLESRPQARLAVPRPDSFPHPSFAGSTFAPTAVSTDGLSSPVQSSAVTTTLEDEKDGRSVAATEVAAVESGRDTGIVEQSLPLNQKEASVLPIAAPNVPITARVSSSASNSQPVVTPSENPATEAAEATTELSISETTVDPSQTASSNHAYRGSPFTPEEELYRLWHGWGAIDAFRAAQAGQGH